ncbi:SAM-dependent methyltransferase [Staphylococcus microti]|uniref:SAM-dependent methyltransferase n=1 Tax=Staphylococcus microti TaxID=569857 RepID=A0A0D6XRT0_9STAP|nr:class I SAM-dependent methyltransferase [Staphylococcus microti]KIX90936.1 SAM-dependent methyltransferase [Staphylococcus microti]PNZ83781.1 class I SAM-dependent methyltransferase [Staphylococcus microti]SUM58493.1 SAM-dependent methyltransferase [Staphylococcus microti]
MRKEAGHTFLAKLGKTRLRPGGKLATDWLIDKGQFRSDKKVLEVACNMCTTAIHLAKTYGCHIEGVDLNKTALAQGEKHVKEAGLSDKIHLQQANAMNLPFEDNSFDIVLNEAMLTMLPVKAKAQALQEYYRVLKPGGVLLTHDIVIQDSKKEAEVIDDLSQAINVNVSPQLKEKWAALYREAGFTDIETEQGPMTLMTPKGMIYDEGVKGTVKIVKNALKKENRPIFMRMFTTFKRHKADLNYIVHAAHKAE